MPEIQQGARSQVRIVTVDGVRCVEKRYNTRKDPPPVKLARELAFYRAYHGISTLPRLVSQEPDLIVITHSPGDRLIDLVRAAAEELDVPQISRSYGQAVAEFLGYPVRDKGLRTASRERANESLTVVIEQTRRAVAADRRYQLPVIAASLDRLPCVLEAEGDWRGASMCKYDWSASNMLIESGREVVCLFDFDTSYDGTRLSFSGDILRSTMLHLDWAETRRGIMTVGCDLPDPNL
jgi:hypothetical protein